MSTLFAALPGLVLGIALLFSVVLFKNETFFAFLLLCPPLLFTLIGPKFGQSAFSESVSGSVVERIKFMITFGTPAVISILGLIRLKSDFSTDYYREKYFTRQLLFWLVMIIFFLNILSIYLNRPINGVGQSVYVPLFAAVVSYLSIFAVILIPIEDRNFQRSVDYIILYLFSFLFVNNFFPILKWDNNLDKSLLFSRDEFRFSPFESLLNLSGRQSFFSSDPETFAIFSLLCFAMIISSANLARRSFGVVLVMVIGSTTQSRLFYIGAIVLTGVFVFDRLLKYSKTFRFFVPCTFLLLSAFLAFVWSSSQRYGLASFSGRTTIWNLLLSNWNSEGSYLGYLFGQLGKARISELSQQVGSRLTFYHSHNLFLEYLWSYGLVGMILIVALVLTLMFLMIGGSRDGLVVLCAVFLSGAIEPTINLSLGSVEFLALLVLFKYASNIRRVAV